MSWLRQDGADVILVLHIQPGAKRTEIVGTHGDALKLRLAAPPVDGKANDALIAFLAATLAVPRKNLELVSGHGARQKRVRVCGANATAVRGGLLPAAARPGHGPAENDF